MMVPTTEPAPEHGTAATRRCTYVVATNPLLHADAAGWCAGDDAGWTTLPALVTRRQLLPDTHVQSSASSYASSNNAGSDDDECTLLVLPGETPTAAVTADSDDDALVEQDLRDDNNNYDDVDDDDDNNSKGTGGNAKSVCTAGRMMCLSLALALAAVLVLAIKPEIITPPLMQVLHSVQPLGIWGPVVLTLIIFVSIPLCIPSTLFNIGGGFLFGWTFLPFLMAGCVAGACAAFLISRKLCKGYAERRLRKNKFFISINKLFARDHGRFSWRSTKLVLLTRASPFFPFVIINFSHGITGVAFSSYTVATLVGTFPWLAIDVYLGTLLEDLAQVGDQHKSMEYLLLLIAFTAVVTAIVTVTARRELRRAEQTEDESARGGGDGSDDGVTTPHDTDADTSSEFSGDVDLHVIELDAVAPVPGHMHTHAEPAVLDSHA